MGWSGIRAGAANRRVVGAAIAAVAGAGVLAGVWSAYAGDAGKGTPAAQTSPVAGGSTRSPAPTPVPGQTSTPDPGLPAPEVSMDIAHATEAGGRTVAITIDDGPSPVWTPQVLQVLKENGVKATFCMIGPEAAANPAIVKQVVADGNRLCDHTVSHNTSMDHRPDAYQKQQILDAANEIEQASGGVAPMYYRAPGGAFTPYSRQIAAANGMRPLGWNVDTKDYERLGVDAIADTVKEELKNGPTILFHDGGGDRSQTVEALKQILPWLKEQGYGFSFPLR
ncbi:polysaccharide deacetylase family protein [Streptomyces sp. RB6PN25]|uniref:Polysaccharide deacetylase family protein n=1 Tax=Streptomyces humicola TaxID=2953240 RepID=A0ABT1PZL4_9ACTN|nr:polysaccharide deacetylase family protein [Streptomyces humicola]MCQ4083111.1 polysaccharide deacetylase family protein [Streptomyces humicola]